MGHLMPGRVPAPCWVVDCSLEQGRQKSWPLRWLEGKSRGIEVRGRSPQECEGCEVPGGAQDLEGSRFSATSGETRLEDTGCFQGSMPARAVFRMRIGNGSVGFGAGRPRWSCRKWFLWCSSDRENHTGQDWGSRECRGRGAAIVEGSGCVGEAIGGRWGENTRKTVEERNWGRGFARAVASTEVPPLGGTRIWP